MNCVCVEHLPRLSYADDCVCLPDSYGKPVWDRDDKVLAIRSAVYAVMDRLEANGGIVKHLGGRPVVVKPNLVLVYNNIGTEKKYYPETTDPRVLDALVLWLRERAGITRVILAESSGRGAPTRANFALSGVDKIARQRGCELYALEERPAVRYALPKAKVQREILVPDIFARVAEGEYAYISVPKMKTNLYTGVTLGFKNAMGVIPYNLRQRAHHYEIDRKLVEMLYLFKPDAVLIDGVVGGEGECPGPVYPVDARVIVAGNHAVETDRVATRMMGFDPSSIKLMRTADELGFGSEDVLVLGDTSPVTFRQADASLVSPRVQARFPGVRVLYGLGRAFSSLELERLEAGHASPEDILRMEASCRGGCVASTRLGFAMLEAEGYTIAKPCVLAIGSGIGKESLWFDSDGKAYTKADIARLPGKKAAIGSCARNLARTCTWYVDGCMPLANAPHAILHRLSGTSCKILSMQNKRLPLLVRSILEQRRARIAVLKSGKLLDVDFPLANTDDRIPEDLAASDAPYVAWPLAEIKDKKTIQRLVAEEDTMALASIMGIIVPCLMEKAGWILKGTITALVTWVPLLLSVLWTGSFYGASAALASLVSAPEPTRFVLSGGISALCFLVWLVLEAMHVLELPVAFREYRRAAKRGEIARGVKRAVLLAAGTLLCGFPAWMPYRLGLHRDLQE